MMHVVTQVKEAERQLTVPSQGLGRQWLEQLKWLPFMH